MVPFSCKTFYDFPGGGNRNPRRPGKGDLYADPNGISHIPDLAGAGTCFPETSVGKRGRGIQRTAGAYLICSLAVGRSTHRGAFEKDRSCEKHFDRDAGST